MQHPMLNIAIMAARKAGDIINHATLELDTIKVMHKGLGDYVSDIDQLAEKTIVDMLLNAYPNHKMIAEEGSAGEDNADSRFQWIIDPIDGTTNFIHGLPHFAVSIALQVNGITEQAVIYAPATNQLFTASKGLGAFCNNRRIRVSKRVRLLEALLGTNSPIKTSIDFPAFGALMEDLTPQTAGVRRTGSAVLDLAYVASGALDACYAVGLKPWDMAAGALMVTEAGGLIAGALGENDYLATGSLVAGSPKIFAQLLPRVGPTMAGIDAVSARKYSAEQVVQESVATPAAAASIP
jgi:myo-inositol-1(or 4)-monophosphatase